MQTERFAVLVKEARLSKDEKRYKCVGETFHEMASGDGTVVLTDGWNLSCDFGEYVGFAVSKDDYREELPSGIPVCPVQNCNDIIFAGQYCKHAPSFLKINAKALFQNLIYSSDDVGKLINLLEEYYGKSFEAPIGSKKSTVLKTLKTQAFVDHQLNVRVDSRGQGTCIRIFLLHGGVEFYKCSFLGCKNEAQSKGGYKSLCAEHINVPCTTPNKVVRKRMLTALDMLRTNADKWFKKQQTRAKDKKKSRIREWEQVMSFLISSKSKSRSFSFKKANFSIVFEVDMTEKTFFYKSQKTGSKSGNRRYLCQMMTCGSSLANNKTDRFCSAHSKMENDCSFKSLLEK